MQLTVRGAGHAMTFESSIEGFDWLAGRAAAAMRARGLELDQATASKLIEMGIDPDDPGPGAGTPNGGCGSPSNNPIGRAPCRDRVCQYVENSGVDGVLKKQTNNKNDH